MDDEESSEDEDKEAKLKRQTKKKWRKMASL